MKLHLGLDVGGTNARAAAVTADGRIVAVHKDVHEDRSPEAVCASLARCVKRVEAEVGIDAIGEVAGLGLAGQIDAATRRVLVAPNLGWKDVDFAPLLEAATGHRFVLLNDLAAAAWGESSVGAARGERDALLVFWGSGIGSGLVLGGRVHTGAHGVAGEFGHTKVRPGGEPCGCGALGCLEAYAGGVNLARRVASLRGVDPSTISMRDIVRDAQAGDAECHDLLVDAAELVGFVAGNVVTLLNPAVVLLGGGVLLANPLLRKLVQQALSETAGASALAGLRLAAPALGDDAGVIGAALWAGRAFAATLA